MLLKIVRDALVECFSKLAEARIIAPGSLTNLVNEIEEEIRFIREEIPECLTFMTDVCAII